MSDLGTFRIDVEVENMYRPGARACRRCAKALIDAGPFSAGFAAA